ncbi:MAG: hypothetical protein D6757_04190, partial [Alphaproteobacteria bacterium]
MSDSRTRESTRQCDLDQKARAILERNDRGGYTVPNGEVYPFQWNWDSAFVALGFSTFAPARAWAELETLFRAQWPDGFVPHIVFWKPDPGYFPGPEVWQAGRDPATSGITQPPVAASVVRWLFEADREGGREHAERLFPALVGWHRWFAEFRDPLKKGLVLVVHPWETGRDNSPEWDAPAAAVDTSRIAPYERRDIAKLDHGMRPTKEDYDRYLAILEFGRDHSWDHSLMAECGPFRVLDVGMTMILIRAERDLLALAEMLGHEAEAAEIRKRLDRAAEGVSFLWNEEVGAFCSYDMVAGRSLPMITSAAFLPFYAGVGTPEQRAALLDHLARIASRVRYLVPSLDPEHGAFDAIRYWRGPVWAVVNFLIARGLADEGE